jgi:hypothetical protein
MMKVLIIAGGYIDGYLSSLLNNQYDYITTCFVHHNRLPEDNTIQLDVQEGNSVKRSSGMS